MSNTTSQNSGIYSGQITEYSVASYGRYGGASGSYIDIDIDNNLSYRGVTDNRFYWDPTAVLQVLLPTSGSNQYEITDISYYQFAITPDLGWPNQEDLFRPYDPNQPLMTNAKLVIKSDLSIANSNIQYDTVKRMVYYSMSLDDMNNILGNQYSRYVWSVRGVTSNGVFSKWAPLRRFIGIYELPSSYIDISNIPSEAITRTITLNGKRHTDIDRIAINGDYNFTRYPSKDTWEYDLLLSGGLNKIVINGIGKVGRPTQGITKTITLSTGLPVNNFLYNTFDDFGGMVGVPRLYSLNESNQSYKDRIEDVFVHPAGSNIAGLHNSICRDLNIDYKDNAIILSPTTLDNRRSDELYTNLIVDIDSNYLYIRANNLKVDNEYHIVNPQGWFITLDHPVNYDNDVTVYSPAGVVVDQDHYTVDTTNNTVVFNLISFIGQPVWVTYNHKLKVAIGPDYTISDVCSGISNSTYQGRQLISYTIATNYGSKSSDGLLRGSYRIRSSSRYTDDNGVIRSGIPIRWSDLSLFKLTDKQFQDRFVNTNNNLMGTKIQAYVDSFNDNAHFTFDKTICDVDTWDPIDPVVGEISYVRGSYQPIKGYWKPTYSDERFPTSIAAEMNFIAELDKSLLSYIGLKQDDFKPGIGNGDDLKVVIRKPFIEEQLSDPGLYRITVGFTTTGQVTDSQYLPDAVFGGQLFSL